MQSIFRLPWSTEPAGSAIMDKAALHKSNPLSVAELPHLINQMKRKRRDSSDLTSAPHAHVVKKWKKTQDECKSTAVANPPPAPAVTNSAHAPSAAPVHLSTPSEARPRSRDVPRLAVTPESQSPTAHDQSVDAPATVLPPGLTAVQQAIEAQINYEILLKHNELRLIEQELAKCQISLEQLRRCSLIPFPGTEGLSEAMSLGTGPTLQPSQGYTNPPYAAPWGVVDGPYTRHYAKWLIPDAKFDSVSEHALAQQAHAEGRTTRGTCTDSNLANRGRTSRTSTGMARLVPLGETPVSAPKMDPLLHKRSTDGQWVRLYCAQCGHSNFSNTQGFLNHCRIKHNQVLKSHDQAAIACGVPVDVNEAGHPVSATEPVATHAIPPAVSLPSAAASGLVHPLASQSVPIPQAKAVYRDPSLVSHDKPRLVTPAKDAKSSSAPYLAAQAQKCGFDGDLKGLVDVMRSKFDFDAIESLDDDDFMESSEASTPALSASPQVARLPVIASLTATANKASFARPVSSKGKPSSHARLSFSFPSLTKDELDHPRMDGSVELSPNTVESNPGLVSDHDDDDDDDADDAHSHHDLVMSHHDVVVEYASDVEGVQERLDDCFEKGEGSRKP